MAPKPQPQLKHLFSPGKIKNVEIKNRIVFQPHWPAYSRDGMPTETTLNYYIERAKGGAGLIIIEALATQPEGQMVAGYVLACDRNTIEPFKRMNRQIHEYGTKVFAQLSHCGPNVKTKPPQLCYSVSQMPEPGSRNTPKAMEKDDIEKAIRHFGISAAIQREAGFDGIDLKFAHDGLLRAFVSPYSNRRTDEYGGNYDNTLHFFREVMAEIRRQVGHDYPVGVRLCLDEFSETGYALDYGVKLAVSCQEAGADYINGDSGGFDDASMQVFPMCVPLGAGVYMASAVKKAVNIPVVAFGRINDPVQCEMLLQEGHADFAGMCRQLICDAETPNKAQENLFDDIRHCIGCNEACVYQCAQEMPVHCVQSPAAGRERLYGIGTLQPTAQPKNIMVIGGGVAGLKFAEIAARRGHKVGVFEKEATLGGQINLAQRLPYRIDMDEVIRYLRMQLVKYGVPCHTGIAVDAETVKRQAPDLVVAATGSRPYVPEIPGAAESDMTVLDVRTVITNPERIGKRVVILDKNGHFQGAGACELALALDASVWYVTPFEKLGVDLDGNSLKHLNRRIYEYNNFEYIVYHDLVRIENGDIIIAQTFGKKEKRLEDIHTLIVCERSVSDNSLYRDLKQMGLPVYAVGDCVAPRRIEQAVFESEMLARTL